MLAGGAIFKKPGDILHSTRGALYVHALEKIRGALYHRHESLLGPPLLWVKAPGWQGIPPKCRLDLATILILGPLLCWECPHPRPLTYTHKN